MTVNAEVLASAGLINGTTKPVKVLGQGEVNQKLFVAADAFSASARRKIEEAGGYIQSLAPEKPVATKRRGAAKAARASRSRAPSRRRVGSAIDRTDAEAAPLLRQRPPPRQPPSPSRRQQRRPKP